MQITCNVCGLAKDESEFYRRHADANRKKMRKRVAPKNYRSWWCRACKSEYDRKRRAEINADPERSKRLTKMNVEKYRSNFQRHWAARQASRARRAGSGGFVSWEEWARLITEHNGKCHWCGVELHESFLTLDHVVPLAEGGGHTINNVVPACANCNHKRRWEQIVKYPEIYKKNGLFAGTRTEE